MRYSQYYTPEDWLLIHIYGEYAARDADINIMPLSELTIGDLPFIREMPKPPDGIIIFDMKSGGKRSGRLEFTSEMKSNLVRFAKENAQEYMEKRQSQKTSPDSV